MPAHCAPSLRQQIDTDVTAGALSLLAAAAGDCKDPMPKSRLVPTIFHEPWWMEIACDGGYRETVSESGGAIVGRLPYLLLRRFPGMTSLRMPRLAHVLGPALAPELSGPGFPRSLRQLAVTADLIAKLPRASHIGFRLHRELTNTLAFDAAGFSSRVDYTVEVQPAPPELLWRQMRDKTRNVIRRAQEQLSVSEKIDPFNFMLFYERNLRERGARNNYDISLCTTLMSECLRRNVGRFLVAASAVGDMEAAVFTVWDDTAEYYFMSTRTLGSMNGAVSLLIWRAIQHAAEKRLIFDMDSVHIRNGLYPNLLLLTGFGGTLKPRYWVRRTSTMFGLAQNIGQLLPARRQ